MKRDKKSSGFLLNKYKKSDKYLKMNSSKSTLIYKILRIPFCYLSKSELYLKLFPVIGKNTDKLVDKITELNPGMIFFKNDTPSRVVFFIGKYKYSTIPRGG